MRIGKGDLRLSEVGEFLLGSAPARSVEITEECRQLVAESHERFLRLLESELPIYGVTTGFGASVGKAVPRRHSEQLQKNLVAYLSCGTGTKLPREAVRAAMLFRLNSLARGFSGVSLELVERLKVFLERDWIPVVPSEGSLGASGDLIPLAYIARALQGEGELETSHGLEKASAVLERHREAPYVLKAKEGLALVNGTSAMAGLAYVNYQHCGFLLSLATIATAWTCLVLRGRPESFGTLVNAEAKRFTGQAAVAAQVSALLQAEEYVPPLQVGGQGSQPIQDKYSLRCAPQVLGPVLDTLNLASQWLETEVNGVSDNPLIGADGLAAGGNFYGGYLAHGMDYMKICLGQIADLADRQLMTIIDEQTNRGLPANLANWHEGNREEHFLHHGLKGLNQSASALTAEILARAVPNSLFSRSCESHNQDKVSLGMSAGTQLQEILPKLYRVLAMQLICLAQGLDLREIAPAGPASASLYALVRGQAPFVERDQPLDQAITGLSQRLQALAFRQNGLFLYAFS